MSTRPRAHKDPAAAKAGIMDLIRSGDFTRAKAACAEHCAQHGRDAEAWFLYGAVCGQLGELEPAAAYLAKALALQPGVPALHYNLGVIQQRLGHFAAAEASLRQAIALAPALAEAHLELGNALNSQGRYEHAIASCQQALRLRPDLAAAHCCLGSAYQAQGALDAAIACYTRATQLAPGLAMAYFQLGVCAAAQGRIDDEIALYGKVVALDPSHLDALNNLGLALKKTGRTEAAIDSYRKAIAIHPGYPKAHVNLGMALQDIGKLDEAEACFNAAIRLQPDSAETHYNLGGLLIYRNQIAQAEHAYRKAIELNPGLMQAHVNLGNTLLKQGRHHEAIEHFRTAVGINPDFVEARSNILFALNYLPDLTPQVIWDEHRAFGNYIRSTTTARPAAQADTVDQSGILRIGYVSADFRVHATAHFLEPVLENHDRARFQVYCYANQTLHDGMTARFRALADCWRDIHSLSDEAAADLIAKDGIDILVDLSGHTHGARLRLFAMRPAPVQISWLGYINTTGLDSMDYRIVDAVSCPPGMYERFHSEQLLRMPRHQWCYRPPEQAPAVGASPAQQQGYVTFASVSNSAKITEPALYTWLDILATVPRSRLLMVGNGLEFRRDAIAARAAARGIGSERIEYIPELPFAGYLELHQRIDVNLDTFPYCGGATACNSLWMGVPVVTLAGATVASRGGASLLHAVGLDELIAGSPADYVAIAVRLANDIEHLGGMRRALRERVQSSTLVDAGAFARDLEKLYRGIWSARHRPGSEQ